MVDACGGPTAEKTGAASKPQQKEWPPEMAVTVRHHCDCGAVQSDQKHHKNMHTQVKQKTHHIAAESIVVHSRACAFQHNSPKKHMCKGTTALGCRPAADEGPRREHAMQHVVRVSSWPCDKSSWDHLVHRVVQLIHRHPLNRHRNAWQGLHASCSCLR